jgi:hypothetical protein
VTALPSGQNTDKVTDSGQVEIAITVTAYNPASDTYAVLVEGRIRNVGKTRVFHTTANITCSITGQASFTGSNFNFDLSPGEVLTFISHSFNLSQNTIGNNGLDFTVHYGVTSTTAFGDNKSVSHVVLVRPAQPGPPQFTNITPTSLTVFWDGSASNGGSNIVSYKLRRWVGSPGHGDFIDSDANSQSRNITGLIPGTTYGFAVYAKTLADDNGGYSDPSTGESIQMLAGAWVRVDGKWKISVPYVRVGGVWKMAIPYVRSGSSWKIAG